MNKPLEPNVDPERLMWELTLLAAYGDCAARHFATVKAWRDAMPVTDK